MDALEKLEEKLTLIKPGQLFIDVHASYLESVVVELRAAREAVQNLAKTDGYGYEEGWNDALDAVGRSMWGARESQ